MEGHKKITLLWDAQIEADAGVYLGKCAFPLLIEINSIRLPAATTPAVQASKSSEDHISR